jgi:hypothetical protein
MVSHVLEVLEKAEQSWRERSPEWKRKVSQWEAWKARQKNKERASQKVATRKRDPDDEVLPQSEDSPWESYFDPQDPSPQFSFAATSAYSKKDILAVIDKLNWTMTPENKFLLRALRRGIAVHHSGLNKSYRILVERYAPSSSLAITC